MISLDGVAGKKIGVYGLGVTGLATCEALVAAEADVFCWDEAGAARAKAANTKYAPMPPKDWPWKEIASLVVSPGIPLKFPAPHTIVKKAHQEKIEVIGDIELFARAVDALPSEDRPRIIAITGSNGKSTTTALIGHILKETGIKVRVGGNIGVPLLALPDLDKDAVYVLELSSYQLDLTKSFRANTGVLLNISPDHLDRHGSMENYIAAKTRIFDRQVAGDVAVIGVDDSDAQAICARFVVTHNGRQVIPVSAEGSLGQGVYALNGSIFYSISGKSGEAGSISDIPALQGKHNWQNACAAIAACLNEGVPPNMAVGSMARFAGLPHRMEMVGREDHILYVNDSKATNEAATAKAVAAFDNVFLLLGGKPKGEGLDRLLPLMENVRGVYLFGEATDTFEEALAGHAICFKCGDLDAATMRAVRDARNSASSQAVVLLSPACASYDQFKNFEERGDRFKKIVRELLKKDGEAA